MTDADDSGAQVPPVNAEDLGWFRDYHRSRRRRLERVQASARVWLGVLTTLLGLLGSVVLFKGGDLITGVTRNGWFQAVLIIVVGLVFVSAVLALIAGGSATWGGLWDITPAAETADAAAGEPAPPASQPPADQKDRTKAEKKSARRARRKQRWFAFWLFFAGEDPDERDIVLAKSPEDSGPAAGEQPWQIYKARSLHSAGKRRAYLHASRTLGVITAALIAVLAVLAIVAGTLAPAPAQVIVIHGGRFTCAPATDHGKFTHVTQVIPVDNC